MRPAGLRHEKIGMKLSQLPLNFAEPHHLGDVYGSSAGFKLPNGDVRSPDIPFVRADRPPDGQAPEGFAEFLPDLTIEIVSPTDRTTEIAEKIGEYLAHGVQMVWLVEPRNRTITVYRSMPDVMTFHATQERHGVRSCLVFPAVCNRCLCSSRLSPRWHRLFFLQTDSLRLVFRKTSPQWHHHLFPSNVGCRDHPSRQTRGHPADARVDRTEQGLKPRFLKSAPPSDADVANVIQKISRRVIRKLRRLGYLEAGMEVPVATRYDPLLDNEPELARTMAASVKQRIAFGERAGEKVRRIGSGFGYEGERPERKGPRCASVNGFSLRDCVGDRPEGTFLARQHSGSGAPAGSVGALDSLYRQRRPVT